MELCINGSLYDVITAPENAYGLCETEFKQVIYDVGEYFVYSYMIIELDRHSYVSSTIIIVTI